MPYGKRWTNRKRKRSRSRSRGRGLVGKYRRFKARRKQAYITRMAGAPERKFLHFQLTANTVSTTFATDSIVVCDSGNGVSDRTGRKILVTSISIKWLAAVNQNATNTFIRFAIVQDRQANEGGISGSDLWNDTSALDAIVSGMNLNNRYRFKVLMNHIECIDPVSRPIGYFEKFIKCHVPIIYDGTGNAEADITSNGISWCMISNEATNLPSVTMDIVVRFVDM